MKSSFDFKVALGFDGDEIKAFLRAAGKMSISPTIF